MTTKLTDLAWNPPTIKRRRFRNTIVNVRKVTSMNVNREKALMAIEKSLPQFSQRKLPSRQEHKRHFLLHRRRSFLNLQRTPHEFFLLRHVMMLHLLKLHRRRTFLPFRNNRFVRIFRLRLKLWREGRRR